MHNYKNTIVTYDTLTATQQDVYDTPDGIRCIAVSGDRTRLAVGCDGGTVAVYNTLTHKKECIVSSTDLCLPISSLSLSWNGQYVLLHQERVNWQRFDLDRLLFCAPACVGYFVCLPRFRPEATLWNTASRACTARIPGAGYCGCPLSITRDDRHIIIGSDVFDIARRTLVRRMEHEVLSPPTYDWLAPVKSNNTIFGWNISSNTPLRPESVKVHDVYILNDKTVITATQPTNDHYKRRSYDATIEICDMASDTIYTMRSTRRVGIASLVGMLDGGNIVLRTFGDKLLTYSFDSGTLGGDRRGTTPCQSAIHNSDVQPTIVITNAHGMRESIFTSLSTVKGRVVSTVVISNTIQVRDTLTQDLIFRCMPTRRTWGATISPDGSVVLSHGLTSQRLYHVEGWDTRTSRPLWYNEYASNMLGRIAFIPDSDDILVRMESYVPLLPVGCKGTNANDAICNYRTGSSRALKQSSNVTVTINGHSVTNCESLSHTQLVIVDNKYIYNTGNNRLVSCVRPQGQCEGYDGMGTPNAFLCNAGQTAIEIDETGSLVLYETASNRTLVTFYLYDDGEWITITPEGYYVCSPNGDKNLNVRMGNRVYGIENFRETFNRPDLVRLALSGQSLSRYKKIEKVNEAPVVRIVEAPDVVTGGEAKVFVAVEDVGGGVGKVCVYLNGSAIKYEGGTGRGELGPGGIITNQYTIPLAAGTNDVRIVGYNRDGGMFSAEAVKNIVAVFARKGPPSLHAVVIGIDQYSYLGGRNNLSNCVMDAVLFAGSLRSGSARLFGEVDMVLLTNRAETAKAGILGSLSNMIGRIAPDDVFVFYAAGHGMVDPEEGQYYMFTSDVGETRRDRLQRDAIDQQTLRDLLCNIPATKKVIVLDMCQSEELGRELQLAFLSVKPRTRAVADDTAAARRLGKAVGSAVFTACAAAQQAVEGYEGHGVFTYVLSEGMRGKADADKDGFVETSELVTYVDKWFDDMSSQTNIFGGVEQTPMNYSSQKGFPLCRRGDR